MCSGRSKVDKSRERDWVDVEWKFGAESTQKHGRTRPRITRVYTVGPDVRKGSGLVASSYIRTCATDVCEQLGRDTN